MKSLRNTRLLFGVTFFITLSLYAPIEVVYLKKVGIPISIISLLNLVVPLTCAFMEIPTGILGDYLGRKKSLLLSQISFFASMLILLYANQIWQFFLVYILEGLGWSFFSGNTDAIVVEDSMAHKADISKQLALFYAGFSFGPVISGILNTSVALLNTTPNFKLLILLSAITRACALSLAFLVKSNNSSDPAIEEQNESPVKLFIQGFNLIKKNSFSTSVIIYEATGRIFFYLPVLIQPLLMQKGIKFIYFGIIFTFAQLVTLAVQYKVDVIVKKFGISSIIKASPIIIALGLLLLFIRNVYVIILSLIMIQAIGPIRNQCLSLQKNNFVSNNIRATYLSSISFCVLIINSLALSLSGVILEKSFYIGILVICIICLSGLIPYKNILNIGEENQNSTANSIALGQS